MWICVAILSRIANNEIKCYENQDFQYYSNKVGSVFKSELLRGHSDFLVLKPFGLCSLLQRRSRDAVCLLNTGADEITLQCKNSECLIDVLSFLVKFDSVFLLFGWKYAVRDLPALSQLIYMKLDLYKVLVQEQQHR